FFFSSRRRHTRWPRDWSSDVCSSDLQIEEYRDRFGRYLGRVRAGVIDARPGVELVSLRDREAGVDVDDRDILRFELEGNAGSPRSEERRVGKEWRSRWGRRQ